MARAPQVCTFVEAFAVVVLYAFFSFVLFFIINNHVIGFYNAYSSVSLYFWPSYSPIVSTFHRSNLSDHPSKQLQSILQELLFQLDNQ